MTNPASIIDSNMCAAHGLYRILVMRLSALQGPHYESAHAPLARESINLQFAIGWKEVSSAARDTVRAEIPTD